MKKNPINIICIFKPQNGANRDKLPSTLICSSIYHIVLEPDEKDIKEVIYKKLENEKYYSDAESLYANYIKAKSLLEKKYQKENFFNLNDISKYIDLRRISYGQINDISILYAIIFIYRFNEEKIIEDLKKELDIKTINMRPSLIYDLPLGKLIYRIGENNKIIIKTFFGKPLTDQEKNKLNNAFVSLTSNQKFCILFLILCVLSKRTCIIQGETSSGKSHVIRIFSLLMGKQINVYQLNSESNTFLLTGHSKLNISITEEESKELNNIFEPLKAYKKIAIKINEKFEKENYNNWSAKSFKELLEVIKNEEENNDEITADEKDKLKLSRKLIEKIINPASRFNTDYDSSFIISMKNGSWNLFDGMESASPQFSEKLATLAGDNPELDLLETGKANYFFTRKENVDNSIKIHENFFLFMCHNIHSQNDKSLDPSLLSKSICFCMTPTDSKDIDTAQIIYGTLIKNELKEKLCQTTATRLAYVHKYAKEKAKREEESFSGDLSPSGRTLGFIGKEFRKFFLIKPKVDKEFEIYKPIYNSLIYLYLNSYEPVIKEKEGQLLLISEKNKIVQKQKLKANYLNNLIQEFKNYREDFILDDFSKSQKYMLIKEELKKLQLYAKSPSKKRKAINFNYIDFLKICFEKIELGDIDLIITYLSQTIHLFSKMENPEDLNAFYYQIKVLNLLFQDINIAKYNVEDEYIQRKISDEELLQLDKLKNPLSKLIIFRKLLELKYISEIKPIYMIYELSDLLKKTVEFFEKVKAYFEGKKPLQNSQKLAMNSFINLLKVLENKKELFELIDLIFPYKHFVSIKKNCNINYLIDAFTKLYFAKINFVIKVKFKNKTENLNFNFKKGTLICTFIINDNFFIDEDTSVGRQEQKAKKIYFKLNRDVINKFIKYNNDKNHELIKWNYIFYLSIVDLTKNEKSELLSEKEIKAIFLKYINQISKVEKEKEKMIPKLAKNEINFNLSKFYISNTESSVFGKAWGLALISNPDFMNYVTIFSDDIERYIIKLAGELYQKIEPKFIESILRLYIYEKFLL